MILGWWVGHLVILDKREHTGGSATLSSWRRQNKLRGLVHIWDVKKPLGVGTIN